MESREGIERFMQPNKIDNWGAVTGAVGALSYSKWSAGLDWDQIRSEILCSHKDTAQGKSNPPIGGHFVTLCHKEAYNDYHAITTYWEAHNACLEECCYGTDPGTCMVSCLSTNESPVSGPYGPMRVLQSHLECWTECSGVAWLDAFFLESGSNNIWRGRPSFFMKLFSLLQSGRLLSLQITISGLGER